MNRGLLILLLGLLPLAAVADGKMIPRAAFPADVSIPEQRALIHFTNGVERLVIETRFSAEGTNFAWIVPLPGVPVIEPATTGLFPTLDYLFQPHIKHRVPKFFIGILVMLAIVGIGVWYSWRAAFLMLLFIALVALVMFPLSLGSARGTAAAGETVRVIDRRTVGVFDTATISSPDAQAIQAWLSDNGFAQPATITNTLQSYASNGWVFVAAKVVRDHAGLSTNAVHPLSFTFKTDRPVYPMRLTGAGADNSVAVDLYVFGPARAVAPHFKVDTCLDATYPEPGEAVWRLPWRESTDVVIQHPLLKAWASNAPVATKLTATLSPSQMEQDVWIDWTRVRETRKTLYSHSARRVTALNWGTFAFAVMLVASLSVQIRKRPLKIFNLGPGWSAALCGAFVAAAVWIILPTTEVRTVAMPGHRSHSDLRLLWSLVNDKTPTNAAQARVEVRRAMDVHSNRFENLLLGGRIREEDSPGNFILRETDGQLDFVIHDIHGAAHVAPPVDF